MLLPASVDRVPEAVGNFIARYCRWTPLGKAVTLVIDVSDDPYLVGKRLTGVVRACDLTSGPLLIQLSPPLEYNGRYLARDLEMVVVCPVLLGHGPGRLLLTWSAVRVIDAPSFKVAGRGFDETMATGRLMLRTAKH